MQERTFERLARLGFAARGAVYILVGGLAVLAALGQGGSTTDSKGALASVLSQPLGYIILACIAFGLICFSLWRAAQAFLNADRLGDSWRDRMRRVGFAFGALVNAALAISAFGLLIGAARSSGGEQSARDGTRWLFSLPFGEWLAALAGAIVIAVGVGVAVRGWRADFEDRLDVDRDVETWARPLGQAGFFARALVFLIVGGFLIFAAWTSNPAQARGLAGALKALQGQPYGWALLALTAGGLFCFGAFQFVLARYRRIHAPDAAPLA